MIELNGGIMTVLRTRSKSTVVPRTFCTKYGFNGPILPRTVVNTVPAVETCYDEIHKDYPREGGPFCDVKEQTVYGHDPSSDMGYRMAPPGTSNSYKGCYLVPPGTTYFTTTLPSYDSATSAAASFGAQGWNKFRPRISKFNFSESLFELKETFKAVWNTAYALSKLRKPRKRLYEPSFKRFLKDGSSAWLALQFGWLPFVSDVRRLLYLIRNYDDQVAQAARINGKWVRRGGTLKKQVGATVALPAPSLTSVFPNKNTVSSFYVPSLTITSNRTSWEKVWFKGTFRYYIPALEDSSRLGRFRTMCKMSGLEITPGNIWQVIPWTWLSDWFLNLDDIIENVTAIQNNDLIAKYAYVMRTMSEKVQNECKVVYRLRVQSSYGAPVIDTTKEHNLISYKERISKTRVAASPFGFGIDWPDFNNWQISILTALGISRVL